MKYKLKKSNSKENHMVVLHTINKLAIGGAEQVMVNLLNGFPDNFCHIVVSLMAPDPEFKKRFTNNKIKIRSFDKLPGNDFSITKKLRRIIKKYNVKLVLCWDWTGYLESILAAKVSFRSIPVIYAVHGKSYTELSAIPFRRKFIHKVSSLLVDKIITVCEYTKNDYCSTYKVNPKKVRVIYNGIDPSKFILSKSKSIKKFNGINSQTIVIGCVARLDPVKNISLLISTFKNLVNEKEDIRLFIVGEGPEEKKLKLLVQELCLVDKVVFTGKRNDIPEILSLFDIYVQPSLFEGISITILEAMAAGLPVITTNVGGNSEIIKNQENGFLIDPGDSDKLFEIVKKLIESKNLRKKIGENAKKTVFEKFSLEKMINSYLNLFSKWN